LAELLLLLEGFYILLLPPAPPLTSLPVPCLSTAVLGALHLFVGRLCGLCFIVFAAVCTAAVAELLLLLGGCSILTSNHVKYKNSNIRGGG
jgi:hypothetical protein